MRVKLFQAIEKAVKETPVFVTIVSNGLSVIGVKNLEKNCSSVWIRNEDGSRLSNDEEADAILQRAIIKAIENGGKLDI